MADDATPIFANDGLTSFASGVGTASDKASYRRWASTPGAGSRLTQSEIDEAYQSSALVRKIHDIPPEEMTKAWRIWSADEAKTKALADEERRLGVQAKAKRVLSIARQRGGSALILGLPGLSQTKAPDTIARGQLKYIHVVARDQLTIQEMETDLNAEGFGKPKLFTLNVGGAMVDIHPSRIITSHGVPIPSENAAETDQRKFWGAPIMESINTAVMQAESVPAELANLIAEAKVDILSIPNLMANLATPEYEARLTKRVTLNQLLASTMHTKIIDGGSPGLNGTLSGGEKWETRQLVLSNIDKTIQTYDQRLCAYVDIPYTKLFGSPPQGMNATGEHDEANFDDAMRSAQDDKLRPMLEALDPYLIASAGVSSADVSWKFAPLKEATPKEEAEIDNLLADTFDIMKGTGLIPYDALSKVQVAVFEQRRNFPGLADAVEESAEEIPAVEGQAMAREASEAANENTAPGTKPATKARTSGVMDAAPRPIRVTRKVMNPQEVLTWARGLGIEGVLPAAELRVEVYETWEAVNPMDAPVDWSPNESGRIIVPPGGPRALCRKDGELYLEFASTALKWRNEALCERLGGLSEGYQPCLLIARGLPNDFDASDLKAYQGRLSLAPEFFSELSPDEPDDDDFNEGD